MRELYPDPEKDWKPKVQRFLLETNSRFDDFMFQAGRWSRELYERFSMFMDRFHIGGWRRWVFIEPLSEGATMGLAGLVVLLALAQSAFRETSDDDWLKKSELAVTFLDRFGNEIGSRGIKHNNSIPLDEFPDALIKATLATEDRRFYEHFGIDVPGTFRALLTNVRAGGVQQGGSSLSQQLAKNLFLTNERTIERKIKEAFLAIWLESRLTKNEILKLYLDRAYLGGGAFGVDAAAQFYFNKSARDVTLSEAAMLAGMFKAPTKFAPHINLPAARARANVVLDNLVEAGFMTEGQVFGARRNPATSLDRRDERSPNYFLDYAFDEVKKLVNGFPKTMTERVFLVRTSVDSGLQRVADTSVENLLRQYGRDYHASQAAVVIADLDGSVRAMVGGRDYTASQFNRATDALRQPGSSFKPYVYAAALESGMKPTSIVVDGPVCIGNWCPHNYSGGYAGSMTLTQALTRSINTIAVKLSISIGNGNPEARPRQDRGAGQEHGAAHAAARHAVAADRRGRSHRARPHRGLCGVPERRHGSRTARAAGSAHRQRRGDLAVRPRRPEAQAGDVAAGRARHEHDDEQGDRGRHRPPRPDPGRARRRQDRHHQRLPRRVVRRLFRQHGRRRVGRQRRLQLDQPHDRRLAARDDLAGRHELCAPGHRN